MRRALIYGSNGPGQLTLILNTRIKTTESQGVIPIYSFKQRLSDIDRGKISRVKDYIHAPNEIEVALTLAIEHVCE